MTTRPATTFEEKVRQILVKADEARQGTRREAGVLHPLGRKAARTRSSLLAAAYQLFIETGYRETSVGAIHEAAGVSLGTFYQYFRDKGDVITTLVGELIIESSEHLIHPGRVRPDRASAVNAVEPYIRHYAHTANFQRVWEEATHIENEVRALRAQVTALIDAGLGAGIARGQHDGTIPTDLDPRETARALNAMVTGYCYKVFVIEDTRDDAAIESVITTVAIIWSRTLSPS